MRTFSKPPREEIQVARWSGSGIGEVRGRVSAERRRWFGSGSAGVPEMWGLVPWETLGDLGSMADRRLVLWIPQIYLIS